MPGSKNRKLDADNDGSRINSLQTFAAEVRDILFGPNSHASWSAVKAELQRLKANDVTPSGAAEATAPRTRVVFRPRSPADAARGVAPILRANIAG